MSSFQILWSNFPSDDPCDAKNEKGKVLFKNQCAIRLSYAMKKSGVSFASFPPGRKCWVHKVQDHILAAKELADWIDRRTVPQIHKSKNVTGENWRDKVKIKRGLPFLKTIIISLTSQSMTFQKKLHEAEKILLTSAIVAPIKRKKWKRYSIK